MKKTLIVAFVSLIFLFTSSTVAYLMRAVLTDMVTALVIGVIILAVSGGIALFAKERRVLNIICIFISSVAMGILLRAWYINRGFDNSFGLMMLISLASVLYITVFFLLSRIPVIRRSKSLYLALCIVYLLASVAGYIFVVFNTETTYVSTFGFYMIIELAFIFAMSLEINNNDELIRNLTLSTYSIFVVAIIVAVFVIVAMAGGGDCDCDCGGADCCECCDGGCDCGGGSDGKKGKKIVDETIAEEVGKSIE